MATLRLLYEVFTVKKGTAPNQDQSNDITRSRRKRELAQFHNLESYHWSIGLGEKQGIGSFPWYGVVVLADHIDDITYTLQGFANETRWTLLKHDMALDYILANQGGLCVALNLTRDVCYTLIPDSSGNIASAQMLGCRINQALWEQCWFKFCQQRFFHFGDALFLHSAVNLCKGYDFEMGSCDAW